MWRMKATLLIFAMVTLVGCATVNDVGKHLRPNDPKDGQSTNKRTESVVTPTWTSDPSNPNNVKIEKAIRIAAKKPTDELTKADLENVTRLYLMDKQLTNVKELENFTQLTYLNLNYNRLNDVRGLEKLTQLTHLYLGGNKLTDVKGLEKLTKLTELWLGVNKLTDVSGLEKLTQLKVLHLSGNELTDVKGLEKLTQLTRLYLSDTPNLTKARIAELQKALPKCYIEHNATK